MTTSELGRWGEELAAGELEAKGFVILRRNFRCRQGEIDLIAEKRRTLVFVEVKRRTSQRYGRPAEAVTPDKQRHIVRTAMLYLQENRRMDVAVRFDVIEVLPGGLRHIEAAFDATGLF